MMDAYYNALFHGFDERIEVLRKQKRYYKFNVMFYRTNLEDHCQMVSWMVEELLPYAKRAFPGYFTLEKESETFTLALVHDDAEILTEDPSFGDKKNMDPRQLSLLESEEEIAIEELASKYPETVNGFNYKNLLLAAMNKDTVMAQFVSVADKAVAFGESFHETYAGNKCFVNRSGDRPVITYIDTFSQQENWRDWPLMGPLFRRRHPFLNKPKRLSPEDLVKIAESGSPHTEKSIRKQTGCPIYEKWKEVMLKRGGQRGLELLLEQREK